MADETRAETSIVDELDKMGKLVVQAAKSAWESEERKKLEAELVEGLRKFNDQVTDAAKKASQSETAQQLKSQAEKVAIGVKEKDVAEDIRKGMLTGLEVINRELGKLIERLETKKTPVETSAPEEASAPDAGAVAAAIAEPAAEASAPSEPAA